MRVTQGTVAVKDRCVDCGGDSLIKFWVNDDAWRCGECQMKKKSGEINHKGLSDRPSHLIPWETVQP